MEENEYLIILYDYYGELLNDLQRNYFELYYFDNLSLSEKIENICSEIYRASDVKYSDHLSNSLDGVTIGVIKSFMNIISHEIL